MYIHLTMYKYIYSTIVSIETVYSQADINYCVLQSPFSFTSVGILGEGPGGPSATDNEVLVGTSEPSVGC